MNVSMEVIEFTPTPEQYAYTFGGVAPVMRIQPGTALKLWSQDAFNNALKSVSDLSSQTIDLSFVNPQTGPFYVEGAEPGEDGLTRQHLLRGGRLGADQGGQSRAV